MNLFSKILAFITRIAGNQRKIKNREFLLNGPDVYFDFLNGPFNHSLSKKFMLQIYYGCEWYKFSVYIFETMKHEISKCSCNVICTIWLVCFFCFYLWKRMKISKITSTKKNKTIFSIFIPQVLKIDRAKSNKWFVLEMKIFWNQRSFYITLYSWGNVIIWIQTHRETKNNGWKLFFSTFHTFRTKTSKTKNQYICPSERKAYRLIHIYL